MSRNSPSWPDAAVPHSQPALEDSWLIATKPGQLLQSMRTGTILCEGDPGDTMLNFRREAEMSARRQNAKVSDSTGYERHWYCRLAGG
jgi:hypothetical protein